MENTESRKFNWLSDSILLGALPVLAYLASYRYESGYVSIFDIPTEFIIISLTSIFKSLFLLFAIVWFSLLCYGNIEIILMNPIKKVQKVIFIVFTILLALSPVLFGIRYFWKELMLVFGLIAFAILTYLGVPLLTQKDKKTYADKLKAEAESDRKAITINDRIFGHIFNIIGPKAYWVILVLFFVIFSIMPLAGIFVAKTKCWFYTINKNQELVVLRIYGDNLICSPINREKGEVTPGVIVIKVSDDTKGPLRLEKVGPLRLKGGGFWQ